MKAYDDKLKIIEMSVVEPPFILDFGRAYLDSLPPHDPETLHRSMIERKEKFGAQFEIVNHILAELERKYGIYLSDVHPGNVRF